MTASYYILNNSYYKIVQACTNSETTCIGRSEIRT